MNECDAAVSSPINIIEHKVERTRPMARPRVCARKAKAREHNKNKKNKPTGREKIANDIHFTHKHIISMCKKKYT